MSMKSLITAIQTDLKNAATLSFVADADIFITPDENIIPMTTAFPAIGLKDGPIQQERASSAGTKWLWNVMYEVHVILYVDMTAGETPVIGQTSPSIKGILDINDLVQTVLHDDCQGITGVKDAYCISEDEGEVIGGSDAIILKKKMTFHYEAQEVK